MCRCWHVHGLSEQYFGDDTVDNRNARTFLNLGDIGVGGSSSSSGSGMGTLTASAAHETSVKDPSASERVNGLTQQQVEDTAAAIAAIADVSSNEQILYFENANLPNIGSVKCEYEIERHSFSPALS